MNILTMAQGSPEWKLARAGKITASMFGTACERLKSGKLSASADKYAFRLACERAGGMLLDEGYETWAMQRGRELEPMARARHCADIGMEVDVCGLVVSDCGRFAASPDGLIGEDGGAEYKCLVSPERLRDVLIDGDLSDFQHQIQGGLWLTGRQWWDFACYCPALADAGLDFYRVRLNPDNAFINAMVRSLSEFDQVVDGYVATLNAKRRAF